MSLRCCVLDCKSLNDDGHWWHLHSSHRYIIQYSVDLLCLTNLSLIGRVCQVNGFKSFHLNTSTVDRIRRWEWAPITIITRLPDQTNLNTLVRTLSSTFGRVFCPLYKRGQLMSIHMCSVYCTLYLTGFDFKNKYLSNGYWYPYSIHFLLKWMLQRITIYPAYHISWIIFHLRQILFRGGQPAKITQRAWLDIWQNLPFHYFWTLMHPSWEPHIILNTHIHTSISILKILLWLW